MLTVRKRTPSTAASSARSGSGARRGRRILFPDTLVGVFIAFLHFMANLLIALVVLRLLQTWLVDRFGPEFGPAKALAFCL